VQVVVHQTEPANRNGKNLIKFLQSVLDPILTPWSRLLTHEMSPTNATRNTVIPTTYGGINKSRTGDSHSKAPKQTIKSVRTSYQIQSARLSLCLSFFVLSDNSANRPKNALNLYSHNSAKTPTTIRPVTVTASDRRADSRYFWVRLPQHFTRSRDEFIFKCLR
jgi:hypothetical protein